MMKGKSCAGQPPAAYSLTWTKLGGCLPAVIASPASSYFPRVFWPKISTVRNDLAAKIPSKIALKKALIH